MKTLYFINLKGIFLCCLLALFGELAHGQLNSSLLAYYPFNGGANDVSGNNYNATTVTATITPDRNNIANSAYFFNGTQRIELPSGQLFDSPDFTVSLWFQATSNANPSGAVVQRIYAGATTVSGRQNFSMNYNLNGNNLVEMRSEPAVPIPGGLVLTAPNIINVGTWYHMVAVRDFANNEVRIYLDNIEVASSLIGFSPNLPSPLDIHSLGMYPTGVQGFVGKIDDVGIWGRALTTTEIDALFKGTDPTAVTTSLFPKIESGIDIYPNPCLEIVTIKLQSEESIEITSLEGKILRNSPAGKEHQLDVSGLNPGIYLIKAGNLTEKIVKN